jgi:uncharacterized SAM-binding protein YcdF (DUF218 family)
MLILALAAVPILAEAIIWTVQTRFDRTRLDDGREIAGFIALGGGRERIAEAMALARNHPTAKVVITGEGEAVLDAAIGAEFIAERGDHRLLIEDKARNTFENAVFTARLIAPRARARWVLVTSASHMPRAIGCFRKAGVSVEAWPVPDAGNAWTDYLWRATHEWGGLVVYWLQGRTDALFPAPEPSEANPPVAETLAPYEERSRS